ncbi:MAG: hypothetical protein ACQEXJ_03005 [Myxococcota bacterium]
MVLRVAVAVSLLVLGACSVGSGVHEPPRPAAEPTRCPPAEPEEVATPRPNPLAGRCAAVCRHVATLTSPNEPAETLGPWLARCEEACLEYASEGQLDCYERVRRPAELEACTVR